MLSALSLKKVRRLRLKKRSSTSIGEKAWGDRREGNKRFAVRKMGAEQSPKQENRMMQEEPMHKKTGGKENGARKNENRMVEAKVSYTRLRSTLRGPGGFTELFEGTSVRIDETRSPSSWGTRVGYLVLHTGGNSRLFKERPWREKRVRLRPYNLKKKARRQS